MNIVIPLGGLGKRFADEGFIDPKPLIAIEGIPMILWAINSLGVKGKYIFILRKSEGSDKIKAVLEKNVPNCLIKEIDYLTEGPASTCLLVKEYIDNEQELIIANCDQIMWWNGDYFLNAARHKDYDGMIVVYYANTAKNSYAKIDRAGYVQEIKEKEIISNVSLNGIHYWKHGKDFVSSSECMIANNDRAINGEFYIGPSYNYMIKSNKTVGIFHIPECQHNAVGTPDDLREYLRKCKLK
jgi:hypothetical protein